MNVGEVIVRLREQKQLTQRELALSAGISQTYLSQIENDHRSPTIETVEVIGGALGVPAAYIFLMSLSAEDLDPDKRELFKAIFPSVVSLVNTLIDDSKAPPLGS